MADLVNGSSRLPRRALLCVTVLIGLLTSGCSVEAALPVPDCQRGQSGIIVAQSVPSAELVPCLDSLPNGWSVDTVAINHDGTEIRLDSDRAGAGAARLLYGPRCELGAAVPVPSDQDGAEAYEFVERIQLGFRAVRYYSFTGGCVWWVFDFDPGASATYSVELQDRLSLFSRQSLNDQIRQTFIDEQL